jgi:hypothetical protein
MTVYIHDVQGLILIGTQIFLIIVTSGLVLGCIQPPVQWAKGDLHLRIEQQSLKLAQFH